jgi:hypothetical protein
MTDTRFCTNCREEIPPRDETCPACGLFAGDVFDGRMPRSPRRGRWVIGFVLFALVVAGLGWLILERRARPAELTEPAPIRVVSDRPGGTRRAAGAAINEAEAIRILRRHFVSTGIASECIAMSSQGFRQGNYHLTAINRCEETRLGRWTVDGKTEEVRRGD